MTRAFMAITAEPWAITPDWLHAIAALAMRDRGNPAVRALQVRAGFEGQKSPEEEAEDARKRRELALLVGIGAAAPVKRLDNGTGRAIVQDRVAVIPLFGPIYPRSNMHTSSGATSITDLRKDTEAALESDAVDAILFSVDSPGGAVSGVNAMADFLFAARKRKPMGAHASGTMASAAYWLGAAAERLTVERTAVVGSIGVIAALPKQVQADRDGEVWIDIVSSGAPNKRPDPTTPEGVLEVRRTLDAIEKQFVEDVARGRAATTEKVRAEFGQGGTVVGADAARIGMADAVTSLEGAMRHMARVGKASRARQAG